MTGRLPQQKFDIQGVSKHLCPECGSTRLVCVQEFRSSDKNFLAETRSEAYDFQIQCAECGESFAEDFHIFYGHLDTSHSMMCDMVRDWRDAFISYFKDKVEAAGQDFHLCDECGETDTVSLEIAKFAKPGKNEDDDGWHLYEEIYRVACHWCGSHTPWHETKEEAIKDWNEHNTETS